MGGAKGAAGGERGNYRRGPARRLHRPADAVAFPDVRESAEDQDSGRSVKPDSKSAILEAVRKHPEILRAAITGSHARQDGPDP